MTLSAEAMFAYELSCFLDFGLTFAIFANVFNMLSFVSTAWAIPVMNKYTSQWSGLGLWKVCEHDGEWGIVECRNVLQLPNLPGWFRGVQFCITMAFIGMKASLALIGAFGCVRRLQRFPVLILAFTISCLASAILSAIGLIVFGAKVESYLSDANMRVSWSFGLEIVAVILITAAGVFGAFEIMSLGSLYKRPSPIRKKPKNVEIPTISGIGDTLEEGANGKVVSSDKESSSPYNTGYDQKESPAANASVAAVASVVQSVEATSTKDADTNPFSPNYKEKEPAVISTTSTTTKDVKLEMATISGGKS